MELLKKVPVPIWIGLGLVLIVILLMSRNTKQPADTTPTAAAGPVTTATVGTQGAQTGAGTDQELGNLSVITQSGFAQLSNQLQNQQSNFPPMNGVGTGQQQMGGAMQWWRNTHALNNAGSGTIGQNAGSNPAMVDNGLPPTPVGATFNAGG